MTTADYSNNITIAEISLDILMIHMCFLKLRNTLLIKSPGFISSYLSLKALFLKLLLFWGKLIIPLRVLLVYGFMTRDIIHFCSSGDCSSTTHTLKISPFHTQDVIAYFILRSAYVPKFLHFCYLLYVMLKSSSVDKVSERECPLGYFCE